MFPICRNSSWWNIFVRIRIPIVHPIKITFQPQQQQQHNRARCTHFKSSPWISMLKINVHRTYFISLLLYWNAYLYIFIWVVWHLQGSFFHWVGCICIFILNGGGNTKNAYSLIRFYKCEFIIHKHFL